MKTASWLLTVALAVAAGPFGLACQAQSSASSPTDSLAAAARRARQDKKSQTASTAVFTNDNLPTAATISVVGTITAAAPASSAPATTATADKTPAKPAASEKATADADALAAAKAKLANAKKDLDLLQRTYNLDQQSYLSNPNHESDASGAGKLQNEKSQIADKQSEVDAAQTEVDLIAARLPAQPAAASSPSPDNNPPTDSDKKPTYIQ